MAQACPWTTSTRRQGKGEDDARPELGGRPRQRAPQGAPGPGRGWEHSGGRRRPAPAGRALGRAAAGAARRHSGHTGVAGGPARGSGAGAGAGARAGGTSTGIRSEAGRRGALAVQERPGPALPALEHVAAVPAGAGGELTGAAGPSDSAGPEADLEPAGRRSAGQRGRRRRRQRFENPRRERWARHWGGRYGRYGGRGGRGRRRLARPRDPRGGRRRRAGCARRTGLARRTGGNGQRG